MPNDIVVRSDKNGGKVHLSADRVYDLNEDKTQDVLNDEFKNTLSSKADEESLAYRRTGATNTGAQIENGTYFYLDGTLKRAIATIATNAYFTAQNCETVTAGGLNALNDRVVNLSYNYRTYWVECNTTAEIENAVAYLVSKMDDRQTAIIGITINVLGQKLPGGMWNGLVFRGTSNYYACLFYGYNAGMREYVCLNGNKNWYQFSYTAL